MYDVIIQKRKSQNQMKLVIENLQESIMIFDKKNLINVNRMFTKQFGAMITQHFN